MNRFRNLLAVFAFSLLILGLPAIASAQWRNDRNNRNDDYNRNDRNSRNDDYNRRDNYNRNLNSTIKNLKNRSKSFEKRLDRELDRSRIDDSRREDRINDLAGNFADAAKRLDDEYDNRRDYNQSQDEVRRVLDLGNQMDRVLSRARLNNNLSRDWNAIRRDLQILAGAYNYNYRDNRNDDYNRNNRNNRNRQGNNDWWRNFPFPN